MLSSGVFSPLAARDRTYHRFFDAAPLLSSERPDMQTLHARLAQEEVACPARAELLNIRSLRARIVIEATRSHGGLPSSIYSC